jgi:hypothetical protein
LASAAVASSVDEEWYLEGSGVPVGWKERAVGFNEVFMFADVSCWIAPGAMVIAVIVVLGTDVGELSLLGSRMWKKRGMLEGRDTALF